MVGMFLQQGNTPLPVWVEIVKALTGPIIAAAFVLIGIWLKEIYERRKAAQAWFEQYYITEGLDIFIAHLISLAFASISIIPPRVISSTVDPLPFGVFARMLTLLGETHCLSIWIDYQVLVNQLEKSNKEQSAKIQNRIEKLIKTIGDIADGLEDIRRRLMVKSVKSKTDIYKLHEDSEIAAVLKDINRIFNEWESVDKTDNDKERRVVSNGSTSTKIDS